MHIKATTAFETNIYIRYFSSIQFNCSVMSDSLQPHELQHTRPPCPSPTPGVHPNPCPLSQWCHPRVSSSVVPFTSCPQSFPASGSLLGYLRLVKITETKSMMVVSTDWVKWGRGKVIFWWGQSFSFVTFKLIKFLKRQEYQTPYMSPEKPVCRLRSNS